MPKYLKFFLFPFALFLGIGIGIITTHEHGFFVLWLNENHASKADFFFQYWTYLGDGLAFVIVLLMLLLVKRRHGYVLGMLGISLAVVSYFLKRIVFWKNPSSGQILRRRRCSEFCRRSKY